MNADFGLLVALVYSVTETLEKFGVERKYAHLLAIPLGVLSSFWGLHCASNIDSIVYGVLIGLGAVGSCDTLCNVVNSLKKPQKNQDN